MTCLSCHAVSSISTLFLPAAEWVCNLQIHVLFMNPVTAKTHKLFFHSGADPLNCQLPWRINYCRIRCCGKLASGPNSAIQANSTKPFQRWCEHHSWFLLITFCPTGMRHHAMLDRIQCEHTFRPFCHWTSVIWCSFSITAKLIFY